MNAHIARPSSSPSLDHWPLDVLEVLLLHAAAPDAADDHAALRTLGRLMTTCHRMLDALEADGAGGAWRAAVSKWALIPVPDTSVCIRWRPHVRNILAVEVTRRCNSLVALDHDLREQRDWMCRMQRVALAQTESQAGSIFDVDARLIAIQQELQPLRHWEPLLHNDWRCIPRRPRPLPAPRALRIVLKR